MITDFFRKKLMEWTKATGAQAFLIPNVNLWFTAMDIYAPLCTGWLIMTELSTAFKCAVIAGGANNQWKMRRSTRKLLMQKGNRSMAPWFLDWMPEGVINVWNGIPSVAIIEKSLSSTNRKNIWPAYSNLKKIRRAENIPVSKLQSKLQS